MKMLEKCRNNHFLGVGALFQGKGGPPTGVYNNRLDIFHTWAGVC